MNPMVFFQLYMGAIGAYGEKTAGEMAEAESKLQAEQIELDATQRERDRKERLNRALSTSIANVAASGVAMEGSPMGSLKEMERLSEVEGQRSAFESRLAKVATRTRGRLTRQKSDATAGLTLAKGAVGAYSELDE